MSNTVFVFVHKAAVSATEGYSIVHEGTNKCVEKYSFGCQMKNVDK